MKRKIKKYLFRADEVERYENLIQSPDEECVNLGIQLFINSKTYKHYLKQVYPSICIYLGNEYYAPHIKHKLIGLIQEYSHLKYKKNFFLTRVSGISNT